MNKRAYRNDIWMLMRTTNTPDSETAAVRLYLDESGGDDPNTPHAVIGGMLIQSTHFQPFEDAWDAMLISHGVEPPLHMKEFGRPHGKLANMTDCCRYELLLEAATLVNSHKIGSVSVSLTNAEYKENFDEEFKSKFSVYGMCFLLTAVMNHQAALENGYEQKIPFILDSGNPYADHVRKSHAEMLEWQKTGFLHLGSLTFAEDDDFGILQAADMIAWGRRRKASGMGLQYPFNPILRILDDVGGHLESVWKPEWMVKLRAALDLCVARIENEKKQGI